MSGFGAPGGGAISTKPTPPERGSFPLDHDGECKDVMTSYLACLKRAKGTNDTACRKLAKSYLSCRMDRNLMAKDEFKNLGFADDKPVETKKINGNQGEKYTKNELLCNLQDIKCETKGRTVNRWLDERARVPTFMEYVIELEDILCKNSAIARTITNLLKKVRAILVEMALRSVRQDAPHIHDSQQAFVSPFQRIFKDGFKNVEIKIENHAKDFEKMTSHVLPANSGLIGVALIVRSKDGPRFVFHYPPRLTSNENWDKPTYGTELDSSTPDASDDEDTSDDDDLDEDPSNLHRSLGRMGLGKKKSRHVSLWDGDDHFENKEGVQIVPWEHLDAFSAKDLASILTPTRTYHKRCFELTLDPLHFVTYPMYIRQDGKWKKTKKQKKKKRKSVPPETEAASSTVIRENDDAPKTKIEDESDYEEGTEQDPEVPSTSGKLENGSTNVSESGIDDGGMNMFNLVFILNPSRLEASARVQDIFENVAKDINKALRYAQHHSNYVWRETDLILLMKDKGREERRPLSSLWDEIMGRSSLASAIRDIHMAISTNNIANVRLDSNPPVRLSLQIPKPFFLSIPPDVDEESMPGVWITTASCLEDQDGEENPVLNKHFALLLLDDEDKIVADIQAQGGDLAAPLLEYLQILKPTLSFLQTAQQHDISLSDIRILAQHLIYYRRAMAIPPLHARDTYILSPNSNLRLLPTASAIWARTFPLSPPLPTFLSQLSTAPRPYKTFAPTKNHRLKYMEMLAWLLRSGWATQLRTFAFVIVWPELRYEVDYALDAERIRRAYDDAVADALEEARTDATTSAAPLSSEAAAEKARLHRLREKAKQDQVDFARRPKPAPTAEPSTNATDYLKHILPRVIRDPYRADYVDSLYLKAIGKRFKDEKVRKFWMKFSKYFDGQEALEKVALNEGLKRKEAWNMILQFEEFLLTTRHW